MTAPQQQSQLPPQQQAALDQQLAAQVAVVIGTAVTADAAVQALILAGVLAGRRDVDKTALRAAVQIAMDFPPDRIGMIGPATGQVIRLNQMRRGQYVVAAARRITSALALAGARRESWLEALRAAVTAEHRYYAQHMMAMWNRADAAARTDAAASEYGLLLGWYSMLDGKTSAECRRAAGRNFRADAMPAIGFPGAVHPHCRCRPGAPHPGASLLPSHIMAPARRARVPVFA